MGGRRAGIVFLLLLISARPVGLLFAQAPAQSSSAKHVKRPAVPLDLGIDGGTVSNGVYRNKALGLSCKIPEGWVLRTDEMNAQDAPTGSAIDGVEPASSAAAKVLLAAFSRPPEARGEEVNDSIVIAAESVSAYPGLKEAAQYLGPLTEVAKAQGFAVDEEPYEIALGAKTLVRGDFHKNMGSRVMHQSTLAMLSHGYAVSITVIGGTDDEVEELIDGIDFQGAQRALPPK
jgi:hypothetical protein